MSGTAANGVDYALLSGTTVIPAGRRYKDLNIRAFRDGLTEPDERVILTIESGNGYELSNPVTGTVTIKNGPNTMRRRK